MSRFQPLPSQPDWPALEREVLAYWRETDAFRELVSKNGGGERWSFLDGPITANNPMGVHHAWGRAYKDIFQRFHAMLGHQQRFQNGFDCQGLWVEVEVEKSLGFKSKRDIEAYGIAEFVRACKQRVLRYAALQTEQSQRLGMWCHWDDPETLRALAEGLESGGKMTVQTPEGPVTDTAERLVGRLGDRPWQGSYFTFSTENNESIWLFLKRCHERGWIYHGVDVMPWCGRCGTGLSHHEIATEGYRELTHLSPTVRFELLDRPGEALLVWTTTPWTLAGNVAAAVGPTLTYLKVRQGENLYWVAEGAARQALAGDYTVEDRQPGTALVGWRYRAPFGDLPAQAVAAQAHRVIPWGEVGAEEGTGIVHIAPGSGAEDFALGKALGLPAIAPLDESGVFVDGFGWLTGRAAGEVGPDVVSDLESRGLLYRAQPYTHRYPVCWRCGSELVFRLVDEWFIRMGPVYPKERAELTREEKAASLRYQMMDITDQIRWLPAFGHERELDWLRNMDDWMISKKRYWGLALPIWVCEDCGEFDVVGGLAELRERATGGWDVLDGHSPHRPYIDAVTLACPACGGTSRRIPDVGNPWLDAGIVPYSTLRYRYDPDYWRVWFPAHFITESFPGQFRNWFYSLLAMSTVLEGKPPFRNVLGYALLFAEDGREMHKSAGNAIEFNEAADKMGADVMRWTFLSARPEQNLVFGYHVGAEVRRRFLIPLWNVAAFFVQYADVAEDWAPPMGAWRDLVVWQPVPGATEMDRWITLRTANLANQVAERMNDYDAEAATRLIEAYVEDLSNWYIRRNRRRFWDAEPAALSTLYRVLNSFLKVVAPFLPFTAEHLYGQVVRAVDGAAPPSVHLLVWPAPPRPTEEDRRLLAEMDLVLKLAGLGRAARSAADVKLRQPLAKATVAVRSAAEAEAVHRLSSHLLDELNVKALEVVTGEGALIRHTVRPVLPLLGPKYGRELPAIRELLAAADPAEVARAVALGEPVELTGPGLDVTLLPDEVEVLATPRPGLATAADAGYVVGISTELTPELAAEGLARDVVRRVQQLRKDSGLAITDRIRLAVDAPDPVRAAVQAWQGFVTGETLAVALDLGTVPEGWARDEAELDGVTAVVGLERVEGES
jgi:isoleucyl-tRNA synthetase